MDKDKKIAELEAELKLAWEKNGKSLRAYLREKGRRERAAAKLAMVKGVVKEMGVDIGALTLPGTREDDPEQYVARLMNIYQVKLDTIISDQPKVLAVHDGTHHIDPCGQLWNVEAKDHHTRPIETVTVILEKKGGE